MTCAVLTPDVDIAKSQVQGHAIEVEGSWLLEPDDLPLFVPSQLSTGNLNLSWNNQRDRIRAVLGLPPGKPLSKANLEDLWRYARYLQLYMGDVLWIEGTYQSENGYLTPGEFRIVRDIQGDFDWDSSCGVICLFHPNGEPENQSRQVPLSQMQVATDNPYHELIEDYRYWFKGQQSVANPAP